MREQEWPVPLYPVGGCSTWHCPLTGRLYVMHIRYSTLKIHSEELTNFGRQVGQIGNNPIDRPHPSRRGRHLKPDESRKARYSTARK
ncbi:hypothetical protein [Spirosoma areae]